MRAYISSCFAKIITSIRWEGLFDPDLVDLKKEISFEKLLVQRQKEAQFFFGEAASAAAAAAAAAAAHSGPLGTVSGHALPLVEVCKAGLSILDP